MSKQTQIFSYDLRKIVLNNDFSIQILGIQFLFF